ncbi:hypothetical protein 3 [Hubei picorna-like virus 67]|uniref:hypothetical protein 3 n=1 Tax=Hubei picorna-like virus 67 TaxID=1923150 RepID=UPI000909693A|nr:hypothetical protein 3 [Hubei picorna-like virus 67]APG78380.1 hypothetical protein 3 [Hubei picorna-like virus 67]
MEESQDQSWGVPVFQPAGLTELSLRQISLPTFNEDQIPPQSFAQERRELVAQRVQLDPSLAWAHTHLVAAYHRDFNLISNQALMVRDLCQETVEILAEWETRMSHFRKIQESQKRSIAPLSRMGLQIAQNMSALICRLRAKQLPPGIQESKVLLRSLNILLRSYHRILTKMCLEVSRHPKVEIDSREQALLSLELAHCLVILAGESEAIEYYHLEKMPEVLEVEPVHLNRKKVLAGALQYYRSLLLGQDFQSVHLSLELESLSMLPKIESKDNITLIWRALRHNKWATLTSSLQEFLMPPHGPEPRSDRYLFKISEFFPFKFFDLSQGMLFHVVRNVQSNHVHAGEIAKYFSKLLKEEIELDVNVFETLFGFIIQDLQHFDTWYVTIDFPRQVFDLDFDVVDSWRTSTLEQRRPDDGDEVDHWFTSRIQSDMDFERVMERFHNPFMLLEPQFINLQINQQLINLSYTLCSRCQVRFLNRPGAPPNSEDALYCDRCRNPSFR